MNRTPVVFLVFGLLVVPLALTACIQPGPTPTTIPFPGGDIPTKEGPIPPISSTIIHAITPLVETETQPGIVPTASVGPVGNRIHVWDGIPTEYPALTPFYIEHGWTDDTGAGVDALFDFTLTVDGVLDTGEDYQAQASNGNITTYNWGYAFPAGLPAGTHIFIGHWWVNCESYVSLGQITGPCTSPSYEFYTRTATVNFYTVP